MKAMTIDDFGGVEKLKFREVTTPQPEENEIQIKVIYTAVNPVDWKIREGYLKEVIPHEFPLILGWDAAGIVSAVGKNVKKFQVNDEVFAYCRKPIVQWGSYAEYICIEELNAAHKPMNVDFAQAASVPLAGLTAWQALFDAVKLKEGEKILIHAGAGGVGSFAIQFAKNAKATIYTTASSKNHAYVKKLGAHYAIDYTKENFVDEVKRLAPERLDVVFDTVGGDSSRESVQLLKPNGRFVSIVKPLDKSLAEKYNIQSHYVFVSPNGSQLEEIATLIEKGKVAIPTIEKMNLSEAATAQEKIRSGHTQGKIVLQVS